MTKEKRKKARNMVLVAYNMDHENGGPKLLLAALGKGEFGFK